ncbi:hypothetical protein R3W88_029591 [Solanum pinnatisectum]|uniref:DUF6821 domain-containing protein n=1 Tax=Solanum pinnatisectum TaxID=50273 RepID=A0AAV9K652_9SOLN|nr:hypothetical protein R3W88_029591 [Solanum pinnatisectum]
MDVESTELQDWELLHPNSPSDSELDLNSTKNHDTFVETEALIQTNYFSMATPFHAYGVEKGSEESDHQFEGVIDVGMLENPKRHPGLGGIDEMGGENEVKLRELEGISEVGVVENSKLQMGFGEIEEMESEGKADVGVVQNSKMEVDFGDIDDIGSETRKEFWPDSDRVGLGGVKFGDVEEMSESCVEEKEENETVEGEKRDKIVGVEVNKAGEQKSSVVWWKVPLELLKYSVFRVRPMWAFSVAAAVMGFVILGRRLYKMKKKTKCLELKVTVDDKKVSQFMSRAARLNEVFSVVKRVPVIRPQLRAAGVSPWPVVSLR